MPKKTTIFFGIFNYQNPQISAIFSFRFMPVTAFAVTTTVNGEYRTECPDGFTKIERTNVKLYDVII